MEVFFETPGYKFKLVPKGRRLGFTQGGAQACIEYMLERDISILWGDTIYPNIIRYFDRYWLPVLKKLGVPFSWSAQLKELKIGNSHCDFRSADNPQNWEGFGYHKILLNEAGIILKNSYLWHNAVLPMLLDFPDSECIVGGTPKGKNSVYWDLQKQALAGESGFWSKTYTTYDNPTLSIEMIELMKKQMPSMLVRQEIYGEFIDAEGAIIQEEWIKESRVLDWQNYKIYFGVDLAISSKTSADYTTIVIGFMDDQHNLHIVDAVRGHWSFNETKNKIVALADKYNPVRIGIEQVAYQAALIQELLRTTKLPVKSVTPKMAGTGDKLTRFLPLAARYEYGFVYHYPGLNSEFKRELLAFTGTNTDIHDDFIDAAVYMYFLANRRPLMPIKF